MQFKNLFTDKSKESKGVYVAFPGEKTEFLIASMNNPAYVREIRRTLGALPRSKQENPEIADPIICKAMAKHICLGWKGEVKDGDKVLKDSEETRELLLLKSPDFRNWISTVATDHERFAAEAQKEEKELLEKP